MVTKTVLIGPPGVGKSTIIKLAKAKGIKATDMEEFGPEKPDRIAKLFELLENEPDLTLFGAADLGSSFPDYFRRILLLPPKEIYLKRLELRNQSDPDKSYQKGEEIYDYFAALKDDRDAWTTVIEDTGTPDETLEIILNSN